MQHRAKSDRFFSVFIRMYLSFIDDSIFSIQVSFCHSLVSIVTGKFIETIPLALQPRFHKIEVGFFIARKITAVNPFRIRGNKIGTDVNFYS